MNMRDKKKLYAKLQNIFQEWPNTIESAVAEEALLYDLKDIDWFFNDLEDHLEAIRRAYQGDAFYAKNFKQIEAIRREYQAIVSGR